MRILPQSLLVIFAVVIQNNVLVSAVPANGTLDTPIKVVHCPFKVTASLAGDLSSIDLIYSTSSSAKTLFGQNKAVCFVRVQFRFSPMEYVSTQELEYEGKFQEKDGGGEIETKAAWDANMTPSLGSLGPVRFGAVQLSSAASRAVAKNLTMVLGQGCYRDPATVGLNVYTTFNPSASGFGANGILAQRFRLRWHGTCDVWFPMCDILDNTGQPHLNCTNQTWTG